MSLTNLKLRNVESRPLTFQEGDDNIKILASASIASMSFDSASKDLVFYAYPSGSATVLFSSSLADFTASYADTSSHFVVTGSSYVSGSIIITGSLNISGSASIEYAKIGKLEVTEFTASTVLVSTGSNIFGNELTDTQEFTGSVSITSSLDVWGTSQVHGYSIVTGSTIFSGSQGVNNTTINTDTNIGYLITDGLGNAYYKTASINMTGSVKITGSLSINGNDISLDSIIDTGSATVTQFISGTLDLVGDGVGSTVLSVSESLIKISSSKFEITGSSNFSGSTNISNQLRVTGSTILSSSVEIIGITQVTGSSYFGSDVNISGSLSHTGSVGVLSDNIVVSSSYTKITSTQFILTGSNGIFGTSSLEGINKVTGSLGISGSVLATGSFDFLGTSSFSGSTFIDGDLYVQTTASFEGPFISKNRNQFGTTVATPITSGSQHEFTGSVDISGSLYVNGNEISFESVIDTGSVSSNQYISGSLLILANDSSSLFVSSSGIVISGSTRISGSEVIVSSSLVSVSASNFIIQVSGSSGSWDSGLKIEGLAETSSAYLLVYDTASNVVSYRQGTGLGFPYTGSAGVSGSLKIDGYSSSLSSSNALEVTGAVSLNWNPGGGSEIQSRSISINESGITINSAVGGNNNTNVYYSGSKTIEFKKFGAASSSYERDYGFTTEGKYDNANKTWYSSNLDISENLIFHKSLYKVSSSKIELDGFSKLTGSVEITGSLGVTGSIRVSNHISASVLLQSGSVGFFGTASQALTASHLIGQVTTGSNNLIQIITGSLVITGSISSGSHNGQVTASDMLITNRLTVLELFTQYITSSTTVNTGSNIFGNSLDDVHEFTGSVRITGSLSLDTNTFFQLGSPTSGQQWRLRPEYGRLYFEYSYDTGSTWNDSIWFEAQ